MTRGTWTAPRLGPAARRAKGERPANAALHFLVRYPPPVEVRVTDPLGRDAKLARVEAALFLADDPVPARRLAEAAGLNDAGEAKVLVEKLKSLYDADGSAFQVEDVAGGYQLLTRPAYHPWLVRLRRTGHEARLSPAALETLAIVAYKQPIMRAEVEAIRGVAIDEMLKMLMEKGLVKVVGRHDSLGRPQLFGTTKKFLQLFGLNAIKDLPEVGVLKPPA
jgi:segregation and condensation protein B